MTHTLLYIKRKIKFYRQIYEFNYLIAKYTHISYLDPIVMPNLSLSSQQQDFYRSRQVMQYYNITDMCLATNNLDVLLNSLSNANLNRILDQLLLELILVNDPATMLYNKKITDLKETFSDMQFQTALACTSKIQLTAYSLEFNFRDYGLDYYRFILLHIINFNGHPGIKQRYRLRFERRMVDGILDGAELTKWVTIDLNQLNARIQLLMQQYFKHFFSMLQY